MTDFDQIIKEKIEQKEYSYSASSWHNFAQKAGLKSALTVTQSVIIAVVSVAVISAGSWLGIRYLAPSQEQEPVAEVTVEEVPVEDPVVVATDTVTTEVSEEPVCTPQPVISCPKVSNPTNTPETPKATTADTVSEPKPAKKPILRPKNPRRILEIDPDTIKSNE